METLFLTKIFLNLILLATSIPVGLLIAWLARDELVSGRKWFLWVMIASVILGAYSYIIGLSYASLALGYLLLLAGVGFVKSKDPAWTKRRL